MKHTDILEALNWRYATKQFDPAQKLSTEQLDRLLEALRLSASSFGLQPWKFVVVEDAAVRQELLPHSWNQPQVVDASHVIVLCRLASISDTEIDQFLEDTATTRDVPVESLEGYRGMMTGFINNFSEEKKAEWMFNQLYLALGNLLTVCAVEGIDACPMEGFSAAEYDRILGLEEKGLNSVVVCPIGFRSEEDKYATLAKVRYPTEDVIVRL